MTGILDKVRESSFDFKTESSGEPIEVAGKGYLVRLSPKSVEMARQYQDEVNKTATLTTTENYTGLVHPDRYFIGELGTIAVWELMKAKRIRCLYDPQADGQSDEGDIFVWKNGEKKSLDVKTASESFHCYMMIPEVKFQKRRCFDAYIAARREGANLINVIGWATRRDIENLGEIAEVHVPTRRTSLGSFREIDSLFSILDSENT